MQVEGIITQPFFFSITGPLSLMAIPGASGEHCILGRTKDKNTTCRTFRVTLIYEEWSVVP